MKFEQFKKPRYYTAIGVAALGLAATSEAALAKPADKPIDSFNIYSGQKIQYVDIYADAGSETAYLNATNIEQVMQDAVKLAESHLPRTITFVTAQGSYDVSFNLDRLTDEQYHEIRLVNSQKAAAAEDLPGCQLTWNAINPYEATDNCDIQGRIETFAISAPAKIKSSMWPGTSPDVLTAALAGCRNVFATTIGLSDLNPMFNGRADGGELRAVWDAANYILCEGFAGAVAAKTAGMSYDQYVSMARDNVITGSFADKAFKASVPPLPKSAWLGLTAAHQAYVA